eukprot:g4690.t1
MGSASSRHRRTHHPRNTVPSVDQATAQTYPYPYPYHQPNRTGQSSQFVINYRPQIQYPPMGQYGQNRRPQSPAQPNCPRGPLPQSKQPSELQQTKTIKNQVNLKKKTLRLIPTEEDKTKLKPEFMFDASAPCSVTVFYMAQEDASKKSKLCTIIQEPGPRAFYEKGLGQKFPKDGTEDLYLLDLSRYEEEDLTGVTGDVTFPLIIRLETTNDKAAADGHSLQDLEPGCPTPTWVQSQTTYAYLKRDEDEWTVVTVKQKIWVEGVSYELQEIYGMQETGVSEKKSEKFETFTGDIEGRECVICLAATRDTTVMPCRHMCMCTACAKELQRQQVSRCPICREPIQSLLHIKRNEAKKHHSANPGHDKSEEAEAADFVESSTTVV